MREPGSPVRLSWLVLAGIVVAILAAGLARGQDDWHAALVIVGALLEVVAVLYALQGIWLARLLRRRSARAHTEAPGPTPLAGERFALTPDEALVAGAMAIAGVLLTLAGSLLA